jgi:predicted  nucleic acid-binding Zn-ribbon protein
MTQAELEASVARHTEEFNEIRAILRAVAQQQAANSEQIVANSEQITANSERLTEVSERLTEISETIAANAEQVAANTTGIVELRALQADFFGDLGNRKKF